MKLFNFLLTALIISSGALAQSQNDLPITWDDTDNVNYTTVPFGGNSSALALDPTNSTNNVLQVNKPLGAATWAGVTLHTTAGLASLIPFDSNNNIIRVKVYSPDSGIVVKLKAEVTGTPTQSVETDALTTVANAWETLEFDFTNESSGTAAINYSYNYDYLSIFFNFGVDGNTAGAKTYYADSVYFVPHMVTFQVDMNQYSGSFTTPEVNGTFNSWCGNCNAMSDTNGDNIWEVTLALTQDSIEFKFAHDNWTGQENLTPNSGCTKTTSGFTNRFIYINGDTILPAVCWESCIECIPPPDTHQVTFQVDMNQYSGTFTTPEVNGDFNAWCGGCNWLSDTNGDNIWEVTLPLYQDSIEFKFAYDGWAGQENLTPNSGCTKTTGGFTNRFIYITGDTILPAVCWESCLECIYPPDTHLVTFQVDMSQYSGSFTTPEVNGTFNSWCGNCNAMSDPDGDNIWEVTIPLYQDSIEYKFAHDNWAGQEELTPGSVCTKTTSGFTNRFIYITGDTVLPAVCWASCEECGIIPDTFNVTFNVDMRGYTGSYTTPELNGNFNGWCGNCNAMADPEGDSIWTISLEMYQDSIEYKFSHDTWTGQEELTEGSVCTKTTSGFTNRFLIITGDTVLPEVCWASCMPCDTTTGLNDLNNIDFSVYPNPASTTIWVEGDASPATLSVYSVQGTKVLEVRTNGSTRNEISIASLPNGIYTLQRVTEQGATAKRFVIAK